MIYLVHNNEESVISIILRNLPYIVTWKNQSKFRWKPFLVGDAVPKGEVEVTAGGLHDLAVLVPVQGGELASAHDLAVLLVAEPVPGHLQGPHNIKERYSVL